MQLKSKKSITFTFKKTIELSVPVCVVCWMSSDEPQIDFFPCIQ